MNGKSESLRRTRVLICEPMGYPDQKACMEALLHTFDSIGYAGIGRQGVARCIEAFEAGDTEKAIREYRQTIGEAPNFAQALTDLDTDSFSAELAHRYGSQLVGVMIGMSLLMNGRPK